MKITPAHDFNDFLVGSKHNLDFVNIFDKKAKLNENAPKKFVGMDRYKAREAILNYLKKSNLLEKKISNKMIVPIGDRGSVIEPLITTQWFVDSKTFVKMLKRL